VAVVVCYVVCAIVWSTTWFAIRVCIADGGYPTLPAAAIRFSIAALVLGVLVWFGFGRPRPRGRRQLTWLAVAGGFNGIAYSLVYRAEDTLPGGVVAVVFGTYSLFTAIGAKLTSTERVRAMDVAAATLSLLGMAVIFWDRLTVSPEQAIGVVFGLASVFASVVYNIIFKREASDVNPLSSTAVLLGVSSLCLWLVSVSSGPIDLPWPPPTAPTLALFYLAILGSVVTFVCYFYMLKRVSLMTASTLVLIQPVLALLVDAVWEDEVRLVGRSYLGVALTFSGVALALGWKWHSARRAAAG
jgi:drug/metabolite transporter (DMT)-like permease